MRRTYKHPPIDEALVELQFAGGDWDLTVPGRLNELLKAEYPGKPRQQNVVSANLVLGQDQPASWQTVRGLGKVQFPSADGKKLVAVGQDVLSVHILRPYTSWEDFSPRVARALEEYAKIVKPTGIKRLGVRYINRILLPEPQVSLDEYFTSAAKRAPGLPVTNTHFVHRDEYQYDDDVQLVVTFASLKSDSPAAFLLDVDVIEKPAAPTSLDRALTRVDELRNRERDVFEMLITDKARAVFNGD